MEEFALQLATKKDLKFIAKIYSDEFSREPYNEPWTEEIAKEKLKKYRKYTDVWKILKGKDIIGFAIINTNWWFPNQTCFLEEFALIKEFQKKGIEIKVLKTISTIYQNKGYTDLTLISKRISRAYKTYENIGFKESLDDALMEIKLKDL